MSELEQTARKIGFLLEGYAIATDSEVLRGWARELMTASLPENQSSQDTDSTETMVESPRVVIAEGGEVEWTEAVAEEIDAALNPEPVQPMADLKPPTWPTPYTTNGSLPETD